MQRSIYLDYAAATPVRAEVLAAMQPYFAEKFYNPSATYKEAQAVKRDHENARARVAHVLGARPSEIIFTAGGTEANNLAIKGVMHAVLAAFPEATLALSSVEHESALRPAGQFQHSVVPVDTQGVIDLERLSKQITDQTALISIMYANNEVGTLQPIRRVAQLVQTIRRERQRAGNKLPLYLHTDACQAGNYLDLHVARLGVDLLTLNGGKIYGPKQSGALYAASHVRLVPQIDGGGQERGLRSGTENIAHAVGLATALEMAQASRHECGQKVTSVQQHFIAALQAKIPTATVNGSLKQRLPNNIHVTFPGQDNERLLFALDERGIMAAAGSACSASNEEPSHVLRAMGLDETAMRASLRFTFDTTTTLEDIDQTVDTLADILDN